MPTLIAHGIEVEAKHKKVGWRDAGGQLSLPEGLWRLTLLLADEEVGEDFIVVGEGRPKPVIPAAHDRTALVRVAGGRAFEVFMVARRRKDLEDPEPAADPEDIETLSMLEHSSWSGWTDWQIRCMRKEAENDPRLEFVLEEVMKMDCWKRWDRQRQTTYEDLSEKEKESDRIEARKKLKAYRPSRSSP